MQGPAVWPPERADHLMQHRPCPVKHKLTSGSRQSVMGRLVGTQGIIAVLLAASAMQEMNATCHGGCCYLQPKGPATAAQTPPWCAAARAAALLPAAPAPRPPPWTQPSRQRPPPAFSASRTCEPRSSGVQHEAVVLLRFTTAQRGGAAQGDALPAAPPAQHDCGRRVAHAVPAGKRSPGSRQGLRAFGRAATHLVPPSRCRLLRFPAAHALGAADPPHIRHLIPPHPRQRVRCRNLCSRPHRRRPRCCCSRAARRPPRCCRRRAARRPRRRWPGCYGCGGRWRVRRRRQGLVHNFIPRLLGDGRVLGPHHRLAPIVHGCRAGAAWRSVAAAGEGCVGARLTAAASAGGGTARLLRRGLQCTHNRSQCWCAGTTVPRTVRPAGPPTPSPFHSPTTLPRTLAHCFAHPPEAVS